MFKMTPIWDFFFNASVSWIQTIKLRVTSLMFHELCYLLQAFNIRKEFLSTSLCYTPVTMANDDSRIVTKLETSLTGDARVVIYGRHMFIVHATE